MNDPDCISSGIPDETLITKRMEHPISEVEINIEKPQILESGTEKGDMASKNEPEMSQNNPSLSNSASIHLANLDIERVSTNQEEEGSSVYGPMTFDSDDLVENFEQEENLDSNDDDDDDITTSLNEEQLKDLIMDMGRVKATLYLRHSIAFFFAFLFMARFSLELLDSSSCIKEILIVLYGYLCYAFFEEINFYYKYKTTDKDTKITYIYAGLDIFSIICSLVILHLKFIKVLPPGNVASLPGLVICGLFYFSPYRRKSAKTLFLIKRFLEAVQIYLIEAKVDGTLNLPWKSILVYTWIYIGIRILLLVSSLKAVKVLIPNNCRRASILLSLWHCLYIVLLLIVLLIYIGYSQAFDSKGELKLLRSCLIGAQYFSGLLLGYTIITKPFLMMIFSRVSSMDYQFSELGEMIFDPLSVGISKKVKMEARDIYFSMVSWTYYKKLKLALLVINKEKLKELDLKILPEKVKQLTKELQGVYVSLAHGLKDNRLVQKVIAIKNNTYIISFFSAENTPENPSRQEEENQFFFVNRENENTKPKKEENSLRTMKESKEMNESMCYVCMEEVADAVVINCGHGGFCYRCAERYMLMKSQCMACRGQAEKIAKIKTKPVFGKIFKGHMIGRLALQVEDSRCQWFLD